MQPAVLLKDILCGGPTRPPENTFSPDFKHILNIFFHYPFFIKAIKETRL